MTALRTTPLPARRPVPRLHELAGTTRHALARIGYVAVILVATLRGLAFEPDLGLALWRLERALVPHLRAADVVDAVRNVALFAGFGAVWIATARPTQLARRVWHATLLGVLLSASVELAQCFSPRRMASVLDVLTNTAGALGGAASLALAVRVTARARRRPALVPPPLLLVALPYAAACWLESFSPLGGLDRVPGLDAAPSRWAAAVAWLGTGAARGPAWWDPVLFGAAGVLAAAWLAERGWPPVRAALAVSGVGALAWTGGELVRGFSGGDLQPGALALRIASTALGAAVGAWLTADAAARRPWRALAPDAARRRDRWALAAYVATATLWSMRPFALVDGWAALVARARAAAWVPLSAHYDSGLHAVPDVAIGFLLWCPVGAWLAARVGGAARWRTLAGGIALAAAAELLQLPVAGRSVDVTDVLVQGAGVLIGWSLLRRADAHAAASRRAAVPASLARAA